VDEFIRNWIELLSMRIDEFEMREKVGKVLVIVKSPAT
jgi:hypothetical protein